MLVLIRHIAHLNGYETPTAPVVIKNRHNVAKILNFKQEVSSLM